MSEHTPGPWFVREEFNKFWGWIIDAEHGGVANASTLDDARLIAAAPEMYEVLKGLEEWSKDPDASWEALARLAVLGEKCREAIAKAEGKGERE